MQVWVWVVLDSMVLKSAPDVGAMANATCCQSPAPLPIWFGTEDSAHVGNQSHVTLTNAVNPPKNCYYIYSRLRNQYGGQRQIWHITNSHSPVRGIGMQSSYGSQFKRSTALATGTFSF